MDLRPAPMLAFPGGMRDALPADATPLGLGDWVAFPRGSETPG